MLQLCEVAFWLHLSVRWSPQLFLTSKSSDSVSWSSLRIGGRRFLREAWVRTGLQSGLLQRHVFAWGYAPGGRAHVTTSAWSN